MMSNAVLKSISATNFGPFNETVTLDMETAVPSSQLIDNHTFIAGDEQRFNKIAYLFGANGSGKSNFCKIILQIKRIILLSPIWASNNPKLMEIQPIKDDLAIPRNYFKFNTASKERSTSYKIQLLLDTITYTYSFEVAESNEILSEELTKKRRRTETILSRSSPSYDSIELKSELKSFQNNVTVVKNNALCLSMASFLNNKLATKIIDAITSVQVINMASMRGLSNLSEDTFSDDKKEKYLKILRSADPTLKDIVVNFNEEKVEKRPFDSDDFENRAVVFKSIRVDVQSTHNIYDNNKVVDTSVLPFLQIESTGTIKLFNVLQYQNQGSLTAPRDSLIGMRISLIRSHISMILSRISLKEKYIVKLMINLFYNPTTNPLNAQLVCTTHNASLINEKVQRDEVWLMMKNEFGESTLKHISDITGLRPSDKLGSKMIDGAFGGMPQILLNMQ